MVYEHLDSQIDSVHERKMGQSQPNTVNCLLPWSDYSHTTQANWIERIKLCGKTHLVHDFFHRLLHYHLLSETCIQMRAQMS